MRGAQWRYIRDVARWICVGLIVVAVSAAIYSVPSPPPHCFPLGRFSSECYMPSAYPFKQDSPILFISGVLVYLLARKVDSKMKTQQMSEEFKRTSTPPPNLVD